MNIISCDNCGVVLDANKLGFRDVIEDENGEVDLNIAVWHDGRFVPYTRCPVCYHQLLKEK